MFQDKDGIREITEDEAKELNIKTDTIKACNTLRRLAKLDRLKIDDSEHRSGLNKHLFFYLEYLGLTPEEFIKQYLSNLQPYMLERRKDQEPDKNFICVIDNIYRMSLYIKANNTFGEEIIVSFHEDNKRGISKDNSRLIKRNTENNLVPIFADSLGSVNLETGNASVKVFVQRGVKILPLSVTGFKYKDTFIVRRGDIERQFIDYCNDYIKDLYTSNLDLDFDKIEVFSVLQQISFTSYGRDTFSSISLLIDSLTTQNDSISKQAADFALVTYVGSLNLTDNQKKELVSLLDEKFMVSSIKGINEILYRIKAVLSSSDSELFSELAALDNPIEKEVQDDIIER